MHDAAGQIVGGRADRREWRAQLVRDCRGELQPGLAKLVRASGRECEHRDIRRDQRHQRETEQEIAAAHSADRRFQGAGPVTHPNFPHTALVRRGHGHAGQVYPRVVPPVLKSERTAFFGILAEGKAARVSAAGVPEQVLTFRFEQSATGVHYGEVNFRIRLVDDPVRESVPGNLKIEAVRLFDIIPNGLGENVRQKQLPVELDNQPADGFGKG